MAAKNWKWMSVALACVPVVAIALTPAVAGPDAATAKLVAEAQGRQLSFDGTSTEGEHAIVLRDAQGVVVRELDLGDFLPADYVHSLPHGDAGLAWWREAKQPDGNERVEFSVPAPGSKAGDTGPALVFSIDLRDGGLRTAQIREYLAAVDQAHALASAAN